MDTGALTQQVREAFLDAFRTAGDMQITVSNASLPTSFNNFLAVPGTSYALAVSNFLEWVESQNLLFQLLKTARRDNPGNPKLAAVVGRFADLERRYTSFLPLDSNGEPLPFEDAEAIVLNRVRFENVGPWLETLGRMRLAVCRIEPQPQTPGDPSSLNGYGMGFLVAPDVVMTNFHVAANFWSDPAAADRVRVRFDYERPAVGTAPQVGKAYALATQRGKERAEGDTRQHPWQCIASPSEKLDFALLRLETPAANDVVRGGERGFLKLTSRDFTPADPLTVLRPIAERVDSLRRFQNARIFADAINDIPCQLVRVVDGAPSALGDLFERVEHFGRHLPGVRLASEHLIDAVLERLEQEVAHHRRGDGLFGLRAAAGRDRPDHQFAGLVK